MRRALSLIFVILAITAGVYLGRSFYYGTWDLFTLSFSEKKEIVGIWFISLFVYWFLIRQDD